MPLKGESIHFGLQFKREVVLTEAGSGWSPYVLNPAVERDEHWSQLISPFYLVWAPVPWDGTTYIQD